MNVDKGKRTTDEDEEYSDDDNSDDNDDNEIENGEASKSECVKMWKHELRV